MPYINIALMNIMFTVTVGRQISDGKCQTVENYNKWRYAITDGLQTRSLRYSLVLNQKTQSQYRTNWLR